MCASSVFVLPVFTLLFSGGVIAVTLTRSTQLLSFCYHSEQNQPRHCLHTPRHCLHMSASSGPDPEEWRQFRNRLVAQGLPLTTDTEDGRQPKPNSQSLPRKSVAPANEELLQKQNAKLWDEYMRGVWAHPSPFEPGSLACRLPLQAQLVELMRLEKSLAADAGIGCSEALEQKEGDSWGLRLRKKLVSELPTDGGISDTLEQRRDLESSWAANSAYCFRLAEGVVSECLKDLAARSNGGRLDARSLTPSETELVAMCQDAQENWQQVVLLLGAEGGRAQGVVLNRPFARRVDGELAQLLLKGELSAVEAESMVVDFVRAFGRDAAVYYGGPDAQAEGGTLVHGFAELEGAQEIASGTRIYRGGAVGAIRKVLAGEASPLDFRWFIGRHDALSTSDAAWASVACARSLALKQCLGLPKPLWHEVLELCGGELAIWSEIELTQRTDLEQS